MKNAKLNQQQLNGKWSMKLYALFPVAKEFDKKKGAQMAEAAKLLGQNKLWTIQGLTLLARAGEGLKTPEVGRFKQFALLEEIEMKGKRVHVRRFRGKGPDEGWISPEVGGKEVAIRVANVAELAAIQGKEILAMFGK